MTKQIIGNRQTLLIFAAAAAFIFMFTASIAAAQDKFKPGDRVECDKASINSWEKGTVMPFVKGDDTGGQRYRVRLDSHARGGMYLEGLLCKVENIRPLGGAAPFKTDATTVPVGPVTVDDENTLSADRAILPCPVEHPPPSKTEPPQTSSCSKK